MAMGKLFRAPKPKAKKKHFKKKTLAKKVKFIVSLIEKKHFNVSESMNFASDETLRAISTMAQGDTSATRTGLKISAKNLYLKFGITWSAGVASSAGVCRMLVILDKNSVGTAPALTDVLESGSTISQYQNVNEGRRFVILYDKIFNNGNSSSTADTDRAVHVVIPINRNIWFLNSGATPTTLGRNQLYVLGIGDSTIASGNAPAVTYNSRLYYEDL